ncbi:MAG TPA: sigma-E factor negative regulatory protein [Gammaproteobacteria bacterium]
MSREIEDQISAFADDELSAEECQFLVRRLERDSRSREKLLRYAVIGASMRGELLDPDPDVLLRRLKQTLDGVSLVPIRPVEAQAWGSRWLRPALGAGIAAAAAVVGLLAIYQPGGMQNEGSVDRLTAQTPAADVTTAPSFVVPRDATVNLAVSDTAIRPPARLTNYLVRHGEYAIGLGRTSIHSTVLSAGNAGQPDDPDSDEE